MRADLILPELSYRLVGYAFKIFNDIGYGHPEKLYQDAYSKLLLMESVPFAKEQIIHLTYLGESIGKYFCDFVIDNKIVLEMKVRPNIGYTHIRQVASYLKTGGYPLAILIYFTRNGIKYRRVVNFDK